jgi:hypothetical protein
MNELVLHHRYRAGSTFDLSRNGNHGVPESVSVGGAGFEDSLSFETDSSAVRVPPSPTLEDLIAIFAAETFWLSPGDGRRYNLMEGHMAFALFVNADWSIEAGIVDSNGVWSGATSAPDAVPTGRWVTAELRYDGINRVTVLLDGSPVVDELLEVGGPISGVAANGVAIGSWPDGAAYAFAGYIAEAKLYRYSPQKDVIGVLDPCCADLRALDEVLLKLTAAGVEAEEMTRLGVRITNVLCRAAALLRGSDPASAREAQAAMNGAVAAQLRGDADAAARYKDRLDELREERGTEAFVPLAEEYVSAFTDIGLAPEDLQELATRLCLVPGQRPGVTSSAA